LSEESRHRRPLRAAWRLAIVRGTSVVSASLRQYRIML
jgi:hypothetical protein